jgi:NADPH-dependent F420 reductase
MSDQPSAAALPDISDQVIGILGGTGAQGRGLAYRFATAGLRVLIGSRAAERAEQAAAELPAGVRGLDNETCAREADLVVAAIPYEGHRELLASLASALAGKILVDCVNPLGFDGQGAYALAVPEGSAAAQAAGVLPDTQVVAAFHHVPAPLLSDESVASLDMDVMVLGDDRRATDLVQALAAVVPGMRGVYAGRLRNAGQVEALIANIISMNRRYKAHAGLRVTGL